jgi:hypothetical protein
MGKRPEPLQTYTAAILLSTHKSRLPALGPIHAICNDLYQSPLSGFSWCTLNVINGPEADSPVLMLDPRKADGFRRQSCAVGADGEQSEVRKINI